MDIKYLSLWLKSTFVTTWIAFVIIRYDIVLAQIEDIHYIRYSFFNGDSSGTPVPTQSALWVVCSINVACLASFFKSVRLM